MYHLKSKLFTLIRSKEFIVILLLALALGFIYRDVLFKNKILFPSNFLVSFYSPWSTQKIPGYPNGVPHKPIGGNDQVRMFYPYRTFITESIERHEFPLWNPYNFSGSPILANFQSATFYPLNLLYLVLPQIAAWSLLGFLQPILGALFMYLYLRLFLSRKSAAFLGAISFGFSGFLITWSQENAVVGHSGLWLPLILYATEKLIDTKSRKYYLILIFSLVSCLLGGHYQFSFYVLALSLIYGIIRIYHKEGVAKKTTVATLCSAYILMLTLSAIQLVPSIEAFTQSPRSSTSSVSVIKEYLLPFTYFINALAPDIFGNPGGYNYFGGGFYQERIFYAGLIPAIFALLAILVGRKNKLVTFFTLTFIITFILAVDSPLTRWLYLLPIPLINTFTPSRILMLTSAAVSILGAFGFQQYEEQRATNLNKKIYSSIALLTSVICIFVAFLYATALTANPQLLKIASYVVRTMDEFPLVNAKVSLRNSILPVAMLMLTAIAVFLRKKTPHTSTALLVLFVLGQLYFLNKYVVIGNREFLYPNNFVLTDIKENTHMTDRFLSFGTPILGNVALDKHIFSPDGIDPVFQSRYGQLIYAAKNNGRFTKNIPRIEATLSEYSENNDIIDNERRLRLISLLGVTRVYNYEPSYKSTENIPKIFPPSHYTPLWNREGWQAYENKAALPRVFLANNYIIEKDPQKVMNILFDPKVDLRNTIVLEEKPEISHPERGAINKEADTAIIQEYKPQQVTIKTTAQSDKILFLSDNYYPGWTATLDTTETKIYRSNYTFRSVFVPKGEHTVIFKFQPNSFKLGTLISCLSLGVLAVVLRAMKPKAP
jgi:hypothetical protein